MPEQCHLYRIILQLDFSNIFNYVRFRNSVMYSGFLISRFRCNPSSSVPRYQP